MGSGQWAVIAFGIANLPMLGWLGAAAAPILIHLLSRRKYREMTWAAMEYLLAAVQRQSRRLQIEQVILLIVRTLVIVLLVLAVAEPFFDRMPASLASGGRTHRVLVVDGSYSMAYKPTDKSRFDAAKELAKRIVEESPQGDGFTLVLMAAPPRVIVGTPVLEAGEMLKELDSLQLVHTTADLPATVAAVRQLIDAAQREAPHLTEHEVYFLTDLGRVGWLPDLPSAAMAEFHRRSAELADLARLAIIDVGQPSAENVAVTGLRALEPVATLAQGVNFEVTLKNFGRQGRTRQAIELLVDGRRVGQQTVDAAAGGEAVATFAHRFETPGDHALEARIAGDALEVDNHRWLVVPVRQSLRVLCINGRPAGEPFQGATDYLAYAISPQDDPGRPALAQAEVAPESALMERDLGRYDCVMLCAVSQFTPSEARVLDTYLKSGGNLILFLGEGVLADRYNRELCAGPAAERILPARLGEVVAEPQYRLDPLDYAHPIVQAFKGRGEAALLTTPVRKYFKLELPKASKAAVALRMSNGDPLIVEESIRRGRVILVATSADASWTAMPLLPSFVPLVQEMLTYCAGGQLQQRNVLVGEPLGPQAGAPTDPGSGADASLTVQCPDGRSRPVAVRPEGDYGDWTFPDTMLSGIYTARFGSSPGHTQSFAVNVDPVEGDLTQLSPEELRTTVWPGIAFDHSTTWQNPERQPVAAALGRSSRLHVGMLYTVLALLLVETFLAWRFGHHSG